ncbi:MAG: AAA family ATPase [Myxococcota bacterium]
MIGRQGTGKSLVAQMLYLFRGLPSLVHFDAATRRSDEPQATDAAMVLQRVVDGLRSTRRSFASLTDPNATIEWSWETTRFSFESRHDTRQIQPNEAMKAEVNSILKERRPLSSALFIPTERLFYTLALSPTSMTVIGATNILELFALFMEDAGRIQANWADAKPDTEDGCWIRDRLRSELGGEALRRGRSWRWSFLAGDQQKEIDLDMASSGQRANWPLMLLPQVLFSMRAAGELTEHFTLYVEEPEIHLHPTAERAVVQVLAYLVNAGFRVVVTTHSLTVLYVLNNLMLASSLEQSTLDQEIPIELRLHPEKVSAYLLHERGEIEELIDRGEGMMDEQALGAVADDIAGQMNRMAGADLPN